MVKTIDKHIEVPDIVISQDGLENLVRDYDGRNQGIFYAIETRDAIICLVPEYRNLVGGPDALGSLTSEDISERLGEINRQMQGSSITYVPFFVSAKSGNSKLTTKQIFNNKVVIHPYELAEASKQQIYAYLFFGVSKDNEGQVLRDCANWQPLGYVVSREGTLPTRMDQTKTSYLNPSAAETLKINGITQRLKSILG